MHSELGIKNGIKILENIRIVIAIPVRQIFLPNYNYNVIFGDEETLLSMQLTYNSLHSISLPS